MNGYCLLNPSKKAEYDRRLRQRLASQRGAQTEATAADAAELLGTAGTATSKDSPGSVIDYSDIASYTSTSAIRKSGEGRKKNSKGLHWQIWAAVATIGILAFGLMTYELLSVDSPARATAKTSAPESSAAGIASSEPDKTSAARTTATNPVSKAIPKSADKPPPAPPDKLADPKVSDIAPARPNPKAVEAPNEKIPEVNTKPQEVKAKPQEKIPEPAVPKKLLVPDGPQQEAAEKTIRVVFQKEYAAAHSAEGRLALAAKLFEQGKQTADDPVARFVLWRLASTEAAGEGEVATSFEYVDHMAELYQVDDLSTKADLLAGAAKALRAAAASSTVALQWAAIALKLVDVALQEDKFEIAAHFLNSAGILGQKTKDIELIHEVTARTHEVDRLKLKYAAVQRALATLQEDPANADASLEVGQWECFTKGSWDKGLPYLAKGSHAELAAVAKLELAQPSDPQEQVALADAWWALVKKTTPSNIAMVVQAHAASLYTNALPKLPSLEKKRVADRLESFKASATGSTGALPGGIVKAGDVALATNGTKATDESGKSLDKLIDGNSTKYSNSSGYQAGIAPCEWTLTFPAQYRLREIRILLYDVDERKHNYTVLVSADGQKYVPLVDRSQGDWAGWQKIAFPPRPVKAMKLVGLRSVSGENFCVVEVEAYCIPPPSGISK